ncbi:MAG: glucosamine-6-phosphate deaminase, partial [Chitinophagaceae bacterium]
MSIDFTDSLERVPVRIVDTPAEGARWVARQVADLIRAKAAAGEKCVLGLATGSTPKLLYAELARLHREEGLSFQHVVAFNLDEYYPIEKDALQSYNRFMKTQLFNKVDIDPANCHIPDGEVPKDAIKEHCAAYERKIGDAGGIDLQILGIGQNGHIGFNEPGSSIHSRTRLVNLENSTRMANAYEFEGMSDVPRLALTMGLGTILKAKKIILMGWGSTKAPVVQKAVEERITEQVPASLLQTHDDVQFVVDNLAAAELTRFKSPWLTGDIEWTSKMIKKAVVNMALHLKKPILSLTNNDYNEYGLSDLLVERGDAYEINLQVFYAMRDSITGWPGGKPNAVIPA